MNKKKLILVLTIVSLLFLMSGCSVPTDEAGNVKLITDETTFSMIMDSEGIFSALCVYPLAKLINWLTPITNVGIAIILVTILVNGLALLLTFKSNVESQKLQMVQPEIAKIQKKYEGKDDQNSKIRAANEMQNIYKKYDIHPFRTMLSQFIQFPILFAIYYAVRRASYVATGTFLGMSLEVTPIQGVMDEHNILYGILFALMIGAQLISMKVPMMLQEKRLKKEAEIHHRRYDKPENPTGNMMYFMIIFIGVLMLSWPSAMSLYYLISSLVAIGKTCLVDKIMHRNKD